MASEGRRVNESRREFLKKAGVAAVAAGVGSMPVWANSTPKKVRLGVVGGNFGSMFVWHLHPDCVVMAVSDLRPERRETLMKAYGCQRAYNSLEELVQAKDIDAVAIFTDGPKHVQHVKEAMKNGKHTISAVPAVWGSLELAEELLDTVKKYGLIYMMAETGHWQQPTISARKWQQEGKFGRIYYCEAEYQHSGLELLYTENGKRTWRYGMAPMHYPTHSSSQLISVTGERLVEVVCHGWGNDDQILKDNPYKNPFWNESAMFKTNKDTTFRMNVWWKGAHRGCERAQWLGDKMSFYGPHYNGQGPMVVKVVEEREKDDAGFVRFATELEPYEQVQWWKTQDLPEPLRIESGHQGSHAFITHDFIDSVLHNRRPAVDVYEALAYTVPGIVAHQSALEGGTLKKIPQFERPKA